MRTAPGRWSRCSAAPATRSSTGNLNVARRAAEEIQRYVFGNAEILKTLAADLQNTGLEQWQQDRILKNYVLQFREFRELTLFDEARRRRSPPAGSAGRVSRSRPITHHRSTACRCRRSASTTTCCRPATFAVHLMRLNQPSGWLVGEFSLEEMWRMVDRIRIGRHGYALVVAPDGTLVAHGDPDKKALVAQARNMNGHPLVAAGDHRHRGGRVPPTPASRGGWRWRRGSIR